MRPQFKVTVGWVPDPDGWCVSVWEQRGRVAAGRLHWHWYCVERYPCPNGHHPDPAEKAHLIQFYWEMQRIKRSKP